MPDNNINDVFQAIQLFESKSKKLFDANRINISYPIIISYTKKPDILIFAPSDKSPTKIFATKNISQIGNRSNYNIYNIEGKISPDSTWITGWRYGPLPNFLHHIFAPTPNQSKYITGPTSEVFLSNQNHKLFGLDNPYKYIEGFYATIIHELGHAIFSNSTEALDIKFINQFSPLNKSELFYPEKWLLPELFAFCTEYSFAKSSLPKHANKLEKLQKRILELMQSKTIPWHTTHVYAIATGIALVQKYPDTWPSRLTNRLTVPI